MRISTKMVYGNFSYSFANSEEIINQKTKQINSGKRIEQPSDDPIGTTRAMSFRTNLTEVSQYIDNSNRAISWLNISDDSLLSVTNYMQRARELVIAGANDTLNLEARTAMADEIDQISSSIMQVANANVDGRFIFAGEKLSSNPYQNRNPVSGGVLNVAVTNINIGAAANNQFSIKLDGNPAVTLTLTSKNYDGTFGNTLDDLANDIRMQLRAAGLSGFTSPTAVQVDVKVTPDNKLAFYAGTQPPDGNVHTLVLRQGVPAANDTLTALGFSDRATTKELVGSKVDFPVPTAAKYPVSNSGTVAGNTVTLNAKDTASPGFYDNWTLMVDDGVNVQTQTVQAGSPGNSVSVAAWTAPAPLPNATYYLSPPLTGLATAGSNNTITLTNASTSNDFFVGMPITITDGTGKDQIRTITDYTAGVVTVDNPFSPPPDNTSRYAIDADYYINANNKFRITIGNQLTQEISLDGANYSPAALAQMIQTKIQERGGQYSNIQVSMTPNNELRIVPQDAADNPLSIKLESGSTADGLWMFGFKNGAVSNEMIPNYEGNRGSIEYEVNVGTKLTTNVVGDSIFDPIFKNLAKVSMDLRAGNTQALSGDDSKNVKNDIQTILLTESEVGAKVNRMEKGIDRFNVVNENLNKLLGDVEDADMTQVIMELKLHQIAYQAALQSGAQVMQMSLLNYLR